MGIFLQFKCHSHANLIFWLLPFMFNFFQSCSTLMECLSPIDGVGLSYFEKCLKPPEKKVICIPLSNGVYFQGYIFNITRRFTSLGLIEKSNLNSNCKNSVWKFAANTWTFFFSERKQSDPNICGVWLVAEMSSYLMNLQEINFRQT